MRLLFAENIDEFLEIGDASASQKLEESDVSVTRLWNIDNVFSLRPSDTLDITEFIDKRNFRIDVVQQVNTIGQQPAHPSFV